MEDLVGSGHFKALNIVVARDAAFGFVKAHIAGVTLDKHALIHRALAFDALKTIVAVERKEGEALADGLFLTGMDLISLPRIDEIIGADQGAVGNDVGRTLLLFTQQSTGNAVGSVTIYIRSNLHEVEWDLALTEIAAPLFHEELQPIGIFIARRTDIGASLIVEDALNGVVEDGVESAVAPQQRAQIVIGELLHHLAGVEFFLSIFLQIVGIKPALHTRSAFVGKYQAHRHIGHAVDLAREEIAHCAAVSHRVDIHSLPLAIGIVLRLGAHHAWNLHKVDATHLRSRGHHLVVVLQRTVAKTLYGKLHVALSGTDPYFTTEQSLDCRLLTIVESHRQRRVAGLGRLDFEEPLSVATDSNRVDITAPRHADAHRLAGLVPSPQASLTLLLQYHAVRNQVWQSDLRLPHERQRKGGKRKQELFSCHLCLI